MLWFVFRMLKISVVTKFSTGLNVMKKNMRVTVVSTDIREDWHLPYEVAEMNDVPLYLVVAMWGLRLKRVITSEDVSRNFYISQRRASDVLYYICHEGTRFVSCERRKVMQKGKLYRRGVFIREVTLPLTDEYKLVRRRNIPKPQSIMPRKTRMCDDITGIKALRQWMVLRQMGEPIPDALLCVSSSGQKHAQETEQT